MENWDKVHLVIYHKKGFQDCESDVELEYWLGNKLMNIGMKILLPLSLSSRVMKFSSQHSSTCCLTISLVRGKIHNPGILACD